MNKEQIIKELNAYPNHYAHMDLENLTENEIFDTFQQHCEKFSQEIEMETIFTDLKKERIFADTPDGWIEVGKLVKKSPRKIHRVVLSDGSNAEVSCDHLLETNRGWVMTQDLAPDELILTKKGFVRIQENIILTTEEVYDWEILHENHRYWVGNMSSHNTGKSFVCLNVTREAQKKGYNVIYCDTEGAIDKSTATKFGIDPHQIRYQPIKTVTEFQTFVSNLLDLVKKAQQNGASPKILLILDSLGMLSTDKELKDAIEGKNAADMGAKAKELRKLFRVITLDLTQAKIPLVCTNHVYCLTAGHKILMSDGTYKNIEDIVVGDSVKTLAGNRNVCSTSEFVNKEVIKLTLENGQTIECTPNHEFLIENEWTREQSWKCSNDLAEGDYILKTRD